MEWQTSPVAQLVSARYLYDSACVDTESNAGVVSSNLTWRNSFIPSIIGRGEAIECQKVRGDSIIDALTHTTEDHQIKF